MVGQVVSAARYAWRFEQLTRAQHRRRGAALASLELEVAIEAMLERFDLEPAGPPARPVRRGVTMIFGGGAPVRVRPRR